MQPKHVKVFRKFMRAIFVCATLDSFSVSFFFTVNSNSLNVDLLVHSSGVVLRPEIVICPNFSSNVTRKAACSYLVNSGRAGTSG